MNSDRIKEIQKTTAYPESISVAQALLQVWNECEQNIATAYFDEQVGHFTDIQKVFKLHQEVDELMEAVNQEDDDHIIDECSDVLAIAYHIATRNGYKGTPSDLFHAAYMKMKGRIERGERDYKKHF